MKKKPNDKSGPVFSRQWWTGSGNIEVSVFENTVAKDGDTFTAYTFSAKRTYKDGDEWKESKGFRSEDLAPLVLLLQEAFSFISEKTG